MTNSERQRLGAQKGDSDERAHLHCSVPHSVLDLCVPPRRAVISAHRLVWLLGCTALLNDHSHCLWGHMHSTMHQVYAPVFRRKFLAEFLGVPAPRVREMMRAEMGTHQQFSPSPPPQAHHDHATTTMQPRPHTDFSVAISAITAH